MTVTFSEALDASTVSNSTIRLLDGGTQITAGLAYNSNAHTVTISPVSALATNRTYTVSISGVKDAAGNLLAQTFTSTFTTEVGDITPPTVTSVSPAGGAGNVSTHTAITITFSETLDAATVNTTNVVLRTGSGTLVPATVSYNAANRTVTLTPSAALSNSTAYTVSIAGVKDTSGNALAGTFTSSFTTEAPDLTPPTVTSINPANGTAGVSTSTAITIAFSEALNASTVNTTTVSLRTSAGTIVPGTVSYNSANHVVTLTPSAALAGGATYTISISGVQDTAGNALAGNFTSSFTTTAQPTYVSSSIWPSTTTPGTTDVGEPESLELGTKFTADVNGFITGVRFYKSAANTGTHVGNLWSASGQLLATGTFTGETASGWQTLTFSSPVAITAGTTYVASYFAPNGHFAVNRKYFASQFNSGSLHVPANGGVFMYGNTSAFPSSSYNASNYWVDVVFSVPTTPPAPDTTPPAVTGINPANNATNVSTSASMTVTFSEALDSSTVNNNTLRLLNGGTQIAASLAYNSNNHTVTITPSAVLANSLTYTISISGVKDSAGNALAQTFSSTFTTAAAPAPGSTTTSLWSSSTTPATVDVGEPEPLELGVMFTADVDGLITGLRFYKGAGNTGTHTANLWSASGQLLATATFTNETASGWQQVTFSNPVAITAGTTYVASYYAPNGHFSVNRNYFSSQFNSGSLHVAANGGVFKYGNSSAFPDQSYRGSNYWVDVLFAPAN